MDVNLQVAESRVHLALNNMHERKRLLGKLRSKKSLHYNRVKHTEVIIDLMSVLLGVMKQDPDNWADEPEIVPF